MDDRLARIRRERELFEGKSPEVPDHPETVQLGKVKELRNRAWRAVEDAIRTGKIKKPPTCAYCEQTVTEAHHHDYRKPLEVIWLCKRHHDIVANSRFFTSKQGRS